jgi:hypothetical protein
LQIEEVIQSSKPRALSTNELELLKFMLSDKKHNHLLNGIGSLRVNELVDGNMGSIRFVSLLNESQAFCLEKAEFRDAEGSNINVAINADQTGALYEIDIWKYDFTPVVEFPGKSTFVRKLT